jgi:hypothetical protein
MLLRIYYWQQFFGIELADILGLQTNVIYKVTEIDWEYGIFGWLYSHDHYVHVQWQPLQEIVAYAWQKDMIAEYVIKWSHIEEDEVIFN